MNPGYLQIEPRQVSDPCYHPRTFAPETTGLDLSRPEGRALAARQSELRVRESFEATLAVQADPALENMRRGFFLVYINSFNEWHEGHAFEPMKDAADLAPAERALGYANPAQGDYRLRALAELVHGLRGREFPREPRMPGGHF